MYTSGSPRRIQLVLAAAVAMLAATLACSSGSKSTEAPANQPDATQAATEAPATKDSGSSSSGSGSVSLDIKNSGTADICEVYIALIDDKSWGKDQLDTKKILPDETFTLTDIPEGTYDLQAYDCQGHIVARAFKQELTGSDFTWTIQSDTVVLTINNKSDSIGCKVFIAAPDDKYWGPNLVNEGDKINPGDSYEISGVTPGTYDVHIETCTGNYYWDSTSLDLTSDNAVNMNN